MQLHVGQLAVVSGPPVVMLGILIALLSGSEPTATPRDNPPPHTDEESQAEHNGFGQFLPPSYELAVSPQSDTVHLRISLPIGHEGKPLSLSLEILPQARWERAGPNMSFGDRPPEGAGWGFPLAGGAGLVLTPGPPADSFRFVVAGEALELKLAPQHIPKARRSTTVPLHRVVDVQIKFGWGGRLLMNRRKRGLSMFTYIVGAEGR